MNKLLQFLIAGCTLCCGGFVKASGAEEPHLLVKVNNLAAFDELTVARAEEIVTGIFRDVGVRVEWRHPAAMATVRAGSAADAGQSSFLINLVSVTAGRMGGDKYEAGLAALPGGDQIGSRMWVFRPTLEMVIDDTLFLTPQRNPTRLRNVLLAHVMAHEMGHLLLGSAEHSGSGIMTRELDLRTIRLACTENLGFSREESGKILATVRAMNFVAYARVSRPPL